MIHRPQLVLDLNEELIVDNFAGGGGASTGIYLGTGRHVDHAINHSADALGMHRINHPQTIHHCEDIFDVDPATVCEGRPVGLAHFSPDCKHFSKAKGGRPLDKRIRGLVLVMLRWAKYGARVMTMENVEEITTWCPLRFIEGKGWFPDPAQKGRTWKAFLAILSDGIAADHPDLPEILDVLAGTITLEDCTQGFGYDFEYRELRACDFGTPTIRKRLFMVARRDGRPIMFPAVTHADPKVENRRKRERGERRLKPWRTIAECIDWNLLCPSIFLDKESARKARCKRPLAPATLRRIAKGVDRYILKAEKPFLVSVTHQGGDRVEPVDEPARTITGAHRGEKAVVAPVMANTANSKTTGRGPNMWPMNEPARTVTTAPGFALASGTLAPFVTEHANASGQRNLPIDEPYRTACAEVNGGHFGLVAGTLIQTGYGERDGQEPRALDVEKPLGTVVAGGGKHAVVSAALVGAGGPSYSGKPKPVDAPMNAQTTESHAALAMASMVKLRGDNVGDAVDSPAHTISAGGNHHGVVAASVVRHFGQSIGQGVNEPAPTVVAGGGGKTGIIAAHMTKFNTGAVGSEMTSPLPTVTSGSHSPATHGGAAGPHGMVAAYLAQHNGGFNETPGHPADEPASTISAKGSQQQIVAAHLQKYYGTDQDPRLDEPSHTVTTKDRFGLVESSAVHPLTPEQIAGARRVAEFLREYGVQFDGEVATVAGFVIVDLGMRMLTPRELYRAQGFGDHYIIDRAWIVDPKTGGIVEVRLTKEQQIRMCGNSVCPQVMAALVKANVPEMCAETAMNL